MIRLLYFPIGYKNTVLPLSGMKYWQYIIMSILHNLLIGGILVLAGYHLDSIDELLNPKKFAEKDFYQKLRQISGYFVLLCTIFVLISLVIFTKVKFEMIRKDEIKKIDEKMGLEKPKEKTEDKNEAEKNEKNES